MSKRTWIVRASKYKGNISGIECMTLEFRYVSIHNAAQEVTNCLTHGDSSMVEWFTRKLNALREIGNGLEFYDNMMSEEFTLVFQRNLDGEPNTWYGASIQSAELKEHTVKALAKIVKEDCRTPDQCVACLKAIYARHTDPSMWVKDDRPSWIDPIKKEG